MNRVTHTRCNYLLRVPQRFDGFAAIVIKSTAPVGTLLYKVERIIAEAW
jgi:hypothetical protein